MAAAARRERAFTLIELAVVLFLLGLIFGGIFMPLTSQVETRKLEETERLLVSAREALFGYVAAHGYFPCPADAAGGGYEPAGTDHASGVCPVYYGFLPGALLGLATLDNQGYAVDAWGGSANRIRYAVSAQTVSGVTRPFTRANGMRTAGIANLADPALSLLHVCSNAAPGQTTGCGGAVTIVSTTPVMLWSSGANAATGGASADEAQNPNANGGSVDPVFVSRLRSNVASGEFDDQLAWIPITTLISRMVASGQLP
jgi:prepilin-type N-terminal cleavage/methylation domain-containing protein